MQASSGSQDAHKSRYGSMHLQSQHFCDKIEEGDREVHVFMGNGETGMHVQLVG